MKILIVIPAYNEENILAATIAKIVDFCQKNLTIDWQVVIADNQSTDQTGIIGQKLARQYPAVSYLFVGQKGKGAAIRSGWQKNDADIYCFMDADLATDLSALPRLIGEMAKGNDVVIGSRFAKGSRVKRSTIRQLFSLGYRLVLKILLATKIKDTPCGFKAINNRVKKNILALVKNQEWFFDSELVIMAEKQGYKIKEIPVAWHDPREGTDKSRVKPLALSLAYFKQALALRKRLKK